MKKKVIISVFHPSAYQGVFNALMVCDVNFSYDCQTGDITCEDIEETELRELLISEGVGTNTLCTALKKE